MTPAMVHSGQVERVREQRKQVLKAANNTHPERFVRGISSPEPLPEALWIKPPKITKEDAKLLH